MRASSPNDGVRGKKKKGNPKKKKIFLDRVLFLYFNYT